MVVHANRYRGNPALPVYLPLTKLNVFDAPDRPAAVTTISNREECCMTKWKSLKWLSLLLAATPCRKRLGR